ncbi:alkaline phosphatase [Thermodesulfovibrionales bacterium]|nr:alkaline phosphatase [Thermodesulfovibrionales bacterium]
MIGKSFLAAVLLLVAFIFPGDGRAENVIFIHPDGTGQGHFTAARLVLLGPDGMLNWDRLPNVAVTRNHIANALSPDSAAGAVAHAAGVKTNRGYYGLCVNRKPLRTVMKDAIDAGRSAGLINTGCITEPGTGVFVASVTFRDDRAEIASQILHAGVDVILGGGERWFLPKGVRGRHGDGARRDGRNLIEEALNLGYTIVYNAEELMALPAGTEKVLGLFASRNIYNIFPPRAYKENTPSLAQMVEVALEILPNEIGFLLVAEEEGTDDFSNINHGRMVIAAVKRADNAIGVALEFAKNNPDTLLITASDSIAGGLSIAGPRRKRFITPCGMEFSIAWAGFRDHGSGTITRAYGKYSELISGTIDNIFINKVIRKALGL